MIYSIYNQTTGQIIKIVHTNEIDLQLRPDESYLEGPIDDTRFYIENGEPVEIPAKPSPYAEFNFITKHWESNSSLAISEVNTRRQLLLTNSDWTDTLSAKTRLGDDLYNQWQAYRQALRDITTQAGYPLTVEWPTAPGSS
jgi:hypothetical protein